MGADTAKPRPADDRWHISEWDRKALPFLVSGLMIAYYVRDIAWSQLVEAASHANLPLAAAAVLLPQLVSWFLGAVMVERTINWFHGPFPLRTYFWVRGGAYLLAFINNAIGGGGLMLYQKTRAEISWPKLLGITLFRVGVSFWGIGLVMIPATLLLHQQGLARKVFSSDTSLHVWWTILIVPGFLFLLSNWNYWFRGRDLTGLGRVLVRDRKAEFWTAFDQSTPRRWLILWALFLPQYLLSILAFHMLNLAFGIHVPFIEAMVALPFAFVIMDLPIAFGGFGTMTLAWMTFFSDYGSVESIAALTLFVPIARLACRGAIGGLSMKPALAEVNRLMDTPGSTTAELSEAREPEPEPAPS